MTGQCPLGDVIKIDEAVCLAVVLSNIILMSIFMFET